MVVVFLLLTSPGVCAQTGASSATLRGQVSAAVAVSIPEARTQSDGARVSSASVDANTVSVSISGFGGDAARVRLPVLLRTNVGYTLRASFLSADEVNVRLKFAGVKATGNFVHADALEGLRLGEALAATDGEPAALPTHRNRLLPFALLSGPPVSKAGTFDSPGNAIEVMLGVDVLPPPGKDAWVAQLTISAAPKR